MFSISVATVIGPTHPGDGEIAETNPERSAKSASPQKLPSSNRLDPTSITIDPSFTISLVRNFGDQIATIMISAFFVISERFSVFELQVVTVAQAFISIRLIGFPTIFERPRTTTFFPETLIS